MSRIWPRVRWSEEVWASDELTANEKLVALAYADHARDRPTAWVTNERLVQRTQLSRRTVISARGSLVAKGWLVVARDATHDTAATYVLGFHRGAADAPLDAARGAATALEGCTTRTQPQDRSINDTSHSSVGTTAPACEHGWPLAVDGTASCPRCLTQIHGVHGVIDLEPTRATAIRETA